MVLSWKQYSCDVIIESVYSFFVTYFHFAYNYERCEWDDSFFLKKLQPFVADLWISVLAVTDKLSLVHIYLRYVGELLSLAVQPNNSQKNV